VPELPLTDELLLPLASVGLSRKLQRESPAVIKVLMNAWVRLQSGEEFFFPSRFLRCLIWRRVSLQRKRLYWRLRGQWACETWV